MTRIVVTRCKVGRGWEAYSDGLDPNRSIAAWGETKEEAIGMLVRLDGQRCGIEIVEAPQQAAPEGLSVEGPPR